MYFETFVWLMKYYIVVNLRNILDWKQKDFAINYYHAAVTFMQLIFAWINITCPPTLQTSTNAWQRSPVINFAETYPEFMSAIADLVFNYKKTVNPVERTVNNCWRNFILLFQRRIRFWDLSTVTNKVFRKTRIINFEGI